MYIRFSILIFFVLLLLAIISSKVEILVAPIIFFLITFFIFLLKPCYKDKKIFYSMILIVVVHQFTVFFNVFVSVLPGAGGDALAFSEHAALIIENDNFFLTIGSALFENIIAIFYMVFGESYLMLSELILIFFSYTCLKFIKILDQFGIKNNKHVPLLFYGLLPSAIIHFSVPLREVFELGFMIISISYLHSYVNSGRRGYLVKLAIPLTLFSILHRATIILAIGIFLFFIIYYFKERSKKKTNKTLIIYFLFFMLVGFTIFFDSSFIDAVMNYRNSTANGNMTYDANIDHTLLGFFFGSLSIYFHYMFGPFLWDVRNIADFIAVTETFVRIFVLYKIITLYRKINKIHPFYKNIEMLLGIYFIITIFWSLGTTNYGTAVRHHLLDWWIICIFIGYLYDKNKKKYDNEK